MITDKKEIAKYYQALLDRNSEFIGVFFVAVRTTGVFCISTCRARKPKLQNVIFSHEVKELLQNGYRPCKICKPTENANEPPEEVIEAVKLVNISKQRITDYELKQLSISPEKIRRWFKQYYGMTFQAYQRMVRINTAFQQLQEGKSVTHTAFGSGYESLSGFGYSFKNIVGQAPEKSRNKSVILIKRITTPLGPMFACATDDGLCLLEFTDRRMLETEFKDLRNLFDAAILPGSNHHIDQAQQELIEYFEGSRHKFGVALHTPGTDLQLKVWEYISKIPYGTTSTYTKMAKTLEKENDMKAVRRALGYSRVAIVIPCHRMIAEDRNLTGYGGGLARKQWLLDHEQKFVDHVEDT